MKQSHDSAFYLGISEGHVDPAVAIVRDGEVIAHMEEERLLRFKHAWGIYPLRALSFCLERAGVSLSEVAAVGVNWDLQAHTDGTMRCFFSQMAAKWPLDEKTKAWQQKILHRYHVDKYREYHESNWHREFGQVRDPPLHPMPHHFVHAVHAYFQSPFERALCLTVDGSGDNHCTVLWDCNGDEIHLLRAIYMPHSLGWYYAAFTEYLGFEAYDGEYKVMGLAAYGRPNRNIQDKIGKILRLASDGIEYRLDPRYIHYGPRTWSDRFTDHLVELLSHERRLREEPITKWHEDVAYAVQEGLEQAVCRLVRWGLSELGTGNLCIGGGVGLNVKMNSRLFALDEVQNLFPQPLCSDSGAASGAALAACWQLSGVRPKPLTSLALGNEVSDNEIVGVLGRCGLAYERCTDIAEAAAEELARGRIVGWFQGRMEAGPRALGQRSILADPRRAAARARVNEIIKFREYWRPFCPSLPAEVAEHYLKDYVDAPFMVLAFDAADAMAAEAPAVVHVDGTARVQLVHREINPLFHRLHYAFQRRTGVPILLNTSFNIKGEPIVSSIHDALRTFYATGLDALACGSYLMRKPARMSKVEECT